MYLNSCGLHISAPKYMSGWRNWKWKNDSDSTMVCRFCKAIRKKISCLHTTKESSSYVSCPTCIRRNGRFSRYEHILVTIVKIWNFISRLLPSTVHFFTHRSRSRIFHSFWRLLWTKNSSEIYDRWYVAERSDVRSNVRKLPGIHIVFMVSYNWKI